MTDRHLTTKNIISLQLAGELPETIETAFKILRATMEKGCPELKLRAAESVARLATQIAKIKP